MLQLKKMYLINTTHLAVVGVMNISSFVHYRNCCPETLIPLLSDCVLHCSYFV